jgi:hypothetical protein
MILSTCRPLDPYGVIIDQHLYGLPPDALIDKEATVVESNLAMLAHPAWQRTEPEDAPQATWVDRTAVSTPSDHLGREIVEADLGQCGVYAPNVPRTGITLDTKTTSIMPTAIYKPYANLK